MNIKKRDFYLTKIDDFYNMLLEHGVVSVSYTEINKKPVTLYRASIERPKRKQDLAATINFSELHRQNHKKDNEMLDEMGKKALAVTCTKNRRFFIYK